MPPEPSSDRLLATPQVVELVSGVDALYLSGRGILPGFLAQELEGLRTEAEAADLPVSAALAGYPVKVQPRAWGKYRYCATHELARFGFTLSENLPVVRVQPTALALHALGPELTVLFVRNFLEAIGLEVVLGVARLDLHADWQGLWIAADERSNVVTYSDRRSLYEVGEELAGLNFGKRGGKLYARIYDKTREMRDKGHDWWPEVWGEKYDARKPVLRVEFEFSREALREFGIDTPEQAFDRSPALWAYATQHWLSLRVPTTDQTRSRWPVDERWTRIQRASLAGGTAPAQRIKEAQRQGDLRTFRKLATGVLSSMAVPMGTHDIADTLAAVGPELDVYQRVSRRTFASRVHEKRQRSAP